MVVRTAGIARVTRVTSIVIATMLAAASATVFWRIMCDRG